MEHKIIVDVLAEFQSEAGRVLPRRLRLEDGTRLIVDRVTDMRRAASLKAGGCGMRYTVLIEGRRHYLFRDEDAWFLEPWG